MFSKKHSSSNSMKQLFYCILLILCFCSCALISSASSSSEEQEPLTLLISITSPPLIGPFGNIIRSNAIAVEARRRGIRVAWMMGKNYKQAVHKVLQSMASKSTLSDNERQFHDHSHDLFYYTETIPVLGSILPEWLSHQLTINGTRKMEAEIPSFIPQLFGERTFANFYIALMMTGFSNGSFLRKIVKEQLQIVQLAKPFAIVKEIEVASLITSHLAGIPIIETISTPMLNGRHSSYISYFVNSATNEVLNEFLEGSEKKFPTVATYDDISCRARNLKVAYTIPELETPLVNERPNVSFIGMANVPAFLQSFTTIEEKMQAVEKRREELLKAYPNQRVLFFYFGKGSIPFETAEREVPKFCNLLNEKVKSSDGKEFHCYIAADRAKEPYSIGKYSHFKSWFDGDDMTVISELTFSHGGANSVMQSIYYGVPQVVSAGYMFERVYNGLSTEIGKCGILLNPDEFSHEIIFEKLFSNNSFKFNQLKQDTKIIQRKLMERGGANQLFSDIEIWLNRSLTSSAKWNEESKQRQQLISNVLLPTINNILERDAHLEKSIVGQLSLIFRDVGLVIPSVIFTIVVFPLILSIQIIKFLSFLCCCKK